MGAIITEYRDVSYKRGRKNHLGTCNNRGAIIDITAKQKGIYTVGAVYANAFTTEQAREMYAVENPFKDGVYDFITYRYQVETYHGGVYCVNELFERQYLTPGFLEILVVYDYHSKLEPECAAVHSYYPYHGTYNFTENFNAQTWPYMTNYNLYLGQKPEDTTPQLNYTAEFTDYAELRTWNYMFMPGHRN